MSNNLTGNLRKMKTELAAPVQYNLIVGDHDILLNEYLEKKIRVEFLGEIHCIQCGRKTNKSFQQGYCFPCMQRINECGNCMIFPERCLVETGRCPEDDWAHRQCHQSHIVYLANSSGLKVGITRKTQVPTRWIDQGALQALPMFKTTNRYQSGMVEVALKAFVSDRTNWRAMLKNEVVPLDLMQQRDQLLEQADSALVAISNPAITVLSYNDLTEIIYPVIEYPKKLTSLSLDKSSEIEGVLLGIKGQYLILDTGVLNIRKFGGYLVRFLLN